MQLQNALSHRLYLSPIQEEISKGPIQINEYTSKSQRQIINSYSQYINKRNRRLSSDISNQNGFKYTQSLHSNIIKLNVNKHLIKPKSYQTKKQIDIYNITPCKSRSDTLCSTSLFLYNGQANKQNKIAQYRFAAKIQKYQNYLVPIDKTNYYKKETIIPGGYPIVLRNNKSLPAINRYIHNNSINTKKHTSSSSQSLKSEFCMRMSRYKIK